LCILFELSTRNLYENKMQEIKFKRTIEPNHNQYYLSIHNQIGFLDGVNDRVLSFIDDKALYSLGIWDFNLNDESLFYS